jgi:hypothetical protein
MKHNVCKICTGWCEIVVVNGIDYAKCRSCGKMDKIVKTVITPLPRQGKDEENTK